MSLLIRVFSKRIMQRIEKVEKLSKAINNSSKINSDKEDEKNKKLKGESDVKIPNKNQKEKFLLKIRKLKINLLTMLN